MCPQSEIRATLIEQGRAQRIKRVYGGGSPVRASRYYNYILLKIGVTTEKMSPQFSMRAPLKIKHGRLQRIYSRGGYNVMITLSNNWQSGNCLEIIYITIPTRNIGNVGQKYCLPFRGWIQNNKTTKKMYSPHISFCDIFHVKLCIY